MAKCDKFSQLTATGVLCPECGEGEMVPKMGRFGPMYRCSEHPTCGFWLSTRPTGYVCTYVRDDGTECGALMVAGTKTIPERCSDKSCPNRNPHKLEV